MKNIPQNRQITAIILKFYPSLAKWRFSYTHVIPTTFQLVRIIYEH